MKLRISRDELKVGMFIERAILEQPKRSTTHVDFIRNVYIDSEATLNELKKKNIKYLVIDTSKNPPPEKPEPAAAVEKKETAAETVSDSGNEIEEFVEKEAETPLPPPDSKPLVPFEKEVYKAKEVKTVAVKTVQNMLQAAAIGKSFDTTDAKENVNDMVESVFRNKDALLSLTRLKSFDNYTFTHSVNVAVISIVMGREIGYNKDQLRVIGLGCMLHDVGKLKIPDSILNKPGKLNDEERKIIQNHPLYSEEILDKRTDIPEVAKRIAYEHHEKQNGKGYPHRKREDEIQEESAIAAIADVYDALTSARVYKPGMPSPHALSFIKARAGTEFRKDLVEKFIQVLGIFPVGSVVEFNTREIGIVTEINRENLFRPYVVIVRDANRQKIGMEKVIGPDYYERKDIKIIRYHDPLDLDIDVSEYLDKRKKVI